MGFDWPAGFPRIPDEEWTRSPIGDLARKYDTVETHGWYRNLDRTVADLDTWVEDGRLILDYSGGTGILAHRLLQEIAGRDFGVLIVDSSPKFLRLAVEKLGEDPRVAFRLIRYLKEEGRIQLPQEVLEAPLLERGVDAVVSTNAIHLYYGLDQTLHSWHDLLASGGRVFIQSGNIGLDDMPEGTWIIDATVEAIHQAARRRVLADDTWIAYREGLNDAKRMERYDRLRRKFFLPVRPLEHYLEALQSCGFRILEVHNEPIEARVDEWYRFLVAYHEGVLGWIGGSERIEDREPSPGEISDRKELIHLAMKDIFDGRESFQAMWTYINAEPA